MKVFALIRKLFGGNRIDANGTGSGVGSVIPSPYCPECKALIVFSHQVLLTGEYRCDCGAVQKVILGASDATRLREVGCNPAIALGDCSVKFFDASPERTGN
jgi:hypothetical protein